MLPHLTLIWVTARREPLFEWFMQSLWREFGGDFDGIRLVIVDYWANPHPSQGEPIAHRIYDHLRGHDCLMVAPKSNPWQGPHRQTREDWFAVANARNTGLAYAERDGWVALIDDLSFLAPGWKKQAYEAMDHPNAITIGAYKKLKKMVVSAGELVSFEENPAGVDHRLKHCGSSSTVACPGGWMFGYVIAPVKAFLETNGYDERCDGLGFEDCVTGINLARKGWSFRYNPNLMVYESEEHHHNQAVMKRSDYGVSPNDKSHKILEIVNGERGDGFMRGCKDCATVSLAELQRRAKVGEPFPEPLPQCREWYTGQLLSELS